MFQTNLLDEIIVDNFAGGGGASTGIELATGYKTIEVRKTMPNLHPPFKCYIYCTLPKERFSIGQGNYA
uniref:hypothetical protein n=1 Tax=Eubacterium sp. TaxID=142586 RepID=UPI004024AD72